MEGKKPDIVKGYISGKRLRPLRGTRPPPLVGTVSSREYRPLSRYLYIYVTLSIYMNGDATRLHILTRTEHNDVHGGRLMTRKEAFAVLCAGRHEVVHDEGDEGPLCIKVTDAIFPNVVENVLDFDGHVRDSYDFIENNREFFMDDDWLHCDTDDVLPNRFNLFVTGLTPCLTGFLQAWLDHDANVHTNLYLWHFNRDTGKYDPQYFHVDFPLR